MINRLSSKRNSGFTLVEMLVSMALLSMVLLISANAYSLFSERWNGRLGKYNSSFTLAKQMTLTQEVLKSVRAYVVLSGENEQAKLYFEGNRNGFVGVAEKSLFNPAIPAVVRFQFVQNADFTFRLEYQESLMSDYLLLRAQQQIEFSSSIVLFDGLTDVGFEYFGWESFRAKTNYLNDPTQENLSKQWSDNFNSLERDVQPEFVRIYFTASDGDYTFYGDLLDVIPGTLNDYATES